MLDRMKKVTDTIDQKRPRVVDRVLASDEKKGQKPKIRSEMKFAAQNYFFICDVCGIEYGPKNSCIPQIDGGIKLMGGFYMHCPECERFICKPRCWNYNVGKCLSCAPSREIEMQRMRPKIRSEHKIPKWYYYFTCDICDKDLGPEKSMAKQADGGYLLTEKHYRQCPSCGKYICRVQCWNYEKGTCTLCNTLTPPEFIVKGEKLKTEYYLVCSICRDQLGPISEVDWEKVKKVALGTTKIAIGAIVTGVTLGAGMPSFSSLTVTGAYDLSTSAKSDASSKKSTQEVAKKVKTDLAQCPSCARWVCIDKCWDRSTGVCNSCSNE